ncbi:YceD family protein [Agrilutibacter niabensis]|nr:YceD family protein [Lysobacter niabensis]
MSAGTPSDRVPEVLDAWRMVSARRGVEGRLPLSALTRLEGSLLDTKGEVRFALEFDRDSLQVPYVELRIDAQLPLVCQRSMDRFLLPVRIVQRLGLIRDEADEAALPEGYEPLLVPDDGELRTTELVEDELILAVPVVPVKPGSEAVERDWPATQVEQERANPFAALSALKKPDK